MNSIDLQGISIKFDTPRKINVDSTDYTENNETMDKFSDVEVNISCPECLEDSTFTIKELLELTGD
jgi:dihydroorotate dehydrogenase